MNEHCNFRSVVRLTAQQTLVHLVQAIGQVRTINKINITNIIDPINNKIRTISKINTIKTTKIISNRIIVDDQKVHQQGFLNQIFQNQDDAEHRQKIVLLAVKKLPFKIIHGISIQNNQTNCVLKNKLTQVY